MRRCDWAPVALPSTPALSTAAYAGFTTADALMEKTPSALFILAVSVANCALPFRMAGSLQKALRVTEAELSTLSVKRLEYALRLLTRTAHTCHRCSPPLPPPVRCC